jgi:hypothetical protein
VLVVYFALIFSGIYYFKAQHSALWAYLVLLTVALVAIIMVTGEHPVRWRWGGK